MAREQFQTLTEPMYYILLALKEECCGVDLRAKVLDLSCGRVQVGSGTLYAMFSRFEENNIIQKTDQKGRKKWYVITEVGKEMLRDEYARLQKMIRDGERFLKERI